MITYRARTWDEQQTMLSLCPTLIFLSIAVQQVALAQDVSQQAFDLEGEFKPVALSNKDCPASISHEIVSFDKNSKIYSIQHNHIKHSGVQCTSAGTLSAIDVDRDSALHTTTRNVAVAANNIVKNLYEMDSPLAISAEETDRMCGTSIFPERTSFLFMNYDGESEIDEKISLKNGDAIMVVFKSNQIDYPCIYYKNSAPASKMENEEQIESSTPVSDVTTESDEFQDASDIPESTDTSPTIEGEVEENEEVSENSAELENTDSDVSKESTATNFPEEHVKEESFEKETTTENSNTRKSTEEEEGQGSSVTESDNSREAHQQNVKSENPRSPPTPISEENNEGDEQEGAESDESGRTAPSAPQTNDVNDAQVSTESKQPRTESPSDAVTQFPSSSPLPKSSVPEELGSVPDFEEDEVLIPDSSPESTLSEIGDLGPISPKSSQCFSGDSLVTLESGEKIRMDQLRIGQSVIDDIRGGSSPIVFFSHADKNARPQFIEITTQLGQKFRATPGHFVYLNRTLRKLESVKIGDKVTLQSGIEGSVAVIERTFGRGLYNPHTLSGDIFVDGVLCSTYTDAILPIVSHALLSPIRALWQVLKLQGRPRYLCLTHGASSVLLGPLLHSS